MTTPTLLNVKYDTLQDNMGELTMVIKHGSGQKSISYNDMYRVWDHEYSDEIFEECNVTVDKGNYLDTPLGTISRPNLVLRFYDDEGRMPSIYENGVLDIVRSIPSGTVYVRDVYEMVINNYDVLLAYEAENGEVRFGEDIVMKLNTIISEFPGFDLVETTENAEVYELSYC